MSAGTDDPIAGKRILTLGAAFAAEARAALAGALIESGEPGQVRGLTAATCDLVLIDADGWHAETLAHAVQELAATKAPPAVLMTGASLPAGLVRNLLRLDRSDVLEAPFTADQLRAAIDALLGQMAAQPAPSAGAHCWAVTGAVGGAGATTLAIEFATALGARCAKPRGVCLIDLNLADGAAAAYLGATPAMRLGDFGGASDRIDAAMLQAFVSPISKSLDLLAAPRDPTAFDTASREAVLRVLDVACELYEWVILDAPRRRSPWTLEVLGGCDEVLVISELTVPALLAARSLSDEIEAGLSGACKPKIVLNRLASRVFGAAPSMAEAERALQRKAEGGISSDWEAAAASANLGGAIAAHRPKSKIVRDVEALVARLTQAGVAKIGQPARAA